MPSRLAALLTLAAAASATAATVSNSKLRDGTGECVTGSLFPSLVSTALTTTGDSGPVGFALSLASDNTVVATGMAQDDGSSTFFGGCLSWKYPGTEPQDWRLYPCSCRSVIVGMDKSAGTGVSAVTCEVTGPASSQPTVCTGMYDFTVTDPAVAN